MQKNSDYFFTNDIVFQENDWFNLNQLQRKSLVKLRSKILIIYPYSLSWNLLNLTNDINKIKFHYWIQETYLKKLYFNTFNTIGEPIEYSNF